MQRTTISMKRGLSLVLLMGVAMLLFISSPASAVVTDYTKEPVGFNTTDNIWWDTDFGGEMSLMNGDVVCIFDHCHSGGMLNDLVGNSKYAAAACDWDEYAWGDKTGSEWSSKFWGSIKTGHSYQDSFDTAKTATVVDLQTPKQYTNGGQAWTAAHRAGDKAILFAGGNDVGFLADIDSAKAALTAQGWGAGDITEVRGGSYQQLQNAIDDAKSDIDEGERLIIYLNDHGCSTDVMKSRVTNNKYEYQFTPSYYRIDDNDGDNSDTPFIYGCREVRMEARDLNKNNYKNPTGPTDDWEFDITDGWIRFYLKEAVQNDPTKWLESGKDYDFSFEYRGIQVKGYWASIERDRNTAGVFFDDTNMDWGRSDNKGRYIMDDYEIVATDVGIWPGWQNGGDGYVWVPLIIPEPAMLTLIAIGAAMMVYRRRR